jgi:hypothetical protein
LKCVSMPTRLHKLQLCFVFPCSLPGGSRA